MTGDPPTAGDGAPEQVSYYRQWSEQKRCQGRYGRTSLPHWEHVTIRPVIDQLASNPRRASPLRPTCIRQSHRERRAVAQ